MIKEVAQWRGAVFIKRLESLSLWSDPKGDSKVIRVKEKKLGVLQDRMRSKVAESRVLQTIEASRFKFPLVEPKAKE